MHPEILRELTAQRGREMRARASQAKLARMAIGAAGADANCRTRPRGSPCPPSPTTWTGRSAPSRPARRRPARRAGRPPPITPPEAVMTIPSVASDLPGMSDPGGMLTPEMSGRASSPVLVGRDEQMAALDAAFASARQGGPSAVLLGGEAGVGKSRLVGEFGRTAAAAGARVLTGGCLELGTDGLPFAPFTAVLRDLVHEMGADAVAAMLPGRTTRGLARLLPELGEPDTGGDPAEARARLFEEVLRALEYLTRHSPVVLVIEDAHWADRSSRDLLTFLIGNQRALSGLLIVVTFRSDELHRTHPLRPLLASLDRIAWVERIELPRLTRYDTGELVAGILGRQPASDLADALYRRSEGNPLFVEALLCCDGELSPELPESLRDLLLDSVRRLPEDTQEVLRVASAGGETTGHVLLGAVTGLDDAALTRAVRPAVIANVLHARGDGYAFRHELIREALHEDLLPGEHGRLHSRFAEAIDADPTLVPPGRAAIEMAHHWHSAHDSAWALIAAWQAAAQAGRAVAAAERLSLLARVLELWDQVPDAAERIGADHIQVLEEATAAAQDAGEFERGIALATSALRELDPGAEPIRAAKLLGSRGHFREKLGRQGLRPGSGRRPGVRARRRVFGHPGGHPAGAGPLPAQGDQRAVLRRGGAGARPPGRRRGERGERAADAGHVQRRPRPAGALGQRSARADRAGPRDGRAPRRRRRAAARGGQRVPPARGGRGARRRRRGGPPGHRERGPSAALPHFGQPARDQSGRAAVRAGPLGRGPENNRRGHGPLPCPRADAPGHAAGHHRFHCPGPGRSGRRGPGRAGGPGRAALGALSGPAPASAGQAGDLARAR